MNKIKYVVEVVSWDSLNNNLAIMMYVLPPGRLQITAQLNTYLTQ